MINELLELRKALTNCDQLVTVTPSSAVGVAVAARKEAFGLIRRKVAGTSTGVSVVVAASLVASAVVTISSACGVCSVVVFVFATSSVACWLFSAVVSCFSVCSGEDCAASSVEDDTSVWEAVVSSEAELL